MIDQIFPQKSAHASARMVTPGEHSSSSGTATRCPPERLLFDPSSHLINSEITSENVRNFGATSHYSHFSRRTIGEGWQRLPTSDQDENRDPETMSQRGSTLSDTGKVGGLEGGEVDPKPSVGDEEFGGTEARKQLEKNLLWKLDIRMSILIVIYILNYIDRNNAAAARLRGFEADLHLKGQEFNTLLSILYVGYIVMQIPSNMFLNYIGKPSIYLPFCMVIWGTISCLTGITTDFVGALLTRFFLGFVEAAFFPGALFLLSKWYTRKELGVRTAMLSCGSLISNAFGSLMASGILSGMEGKLGHAAWRWLFFIEGALTVFVAICAIFVLPDFPATSSTWLSPLEVRLAEKRMEEDVGVGDEAETETGGQTHGMVLALTDWKVWWLALTLTSMVVSLSFNAFFPTLSQTMGYNTTVTLLLCAPPWAFATIVAFVVTRHSDMAGERCYHIVVPLFFGLVGFVIALSTMNTAARYVSLFLMAQSYAGFIVFLTWISSSIPRPPSKRAVALAFINAFSQLGNIAGSYVWPSGWGPSYKHSYAICISTNGLAIVMCLCFRKHLQSLNKDLAVKEEEEGKPEGFRYLE